MSAKKITWGDIIKRSQQNQSGNREADTAEKAEKSASDSTDDIIQTTDENEPAISDLSGNNDWDKYAFPSADYPGAGVGHTIVCQVIQSHSA